MSAFEARIADAYMEACMDELEAPKPGNVHIHADGHGSTVADFRRSAEVSAGSIAKTEATVGARILGAIEATHAAVGQNTNLGIVLLCAPLARAAEQQKHPGANQLSRITSPGSCLNPHRAGPQVLPMQ